MKITHNVGLNFEHIYVPDSQLFGAILDWWTGKKSQNFDFYSLKPTEIKSLEILFLCFLCPFAAISKLLQKTHLEEQASQIQVAIDEYDKIP